MPRMPQTQRRELNNLQKGKIISLLDMDTSYAEIGRQTGIPAMIHPTYVLCMLAGVCKLRKIKFRLANKHGQGLYINNVTAKRITVCQTNYTAWLGEKFPTSHTHTHTLCLFSRAGAPHTHTPLVFLTGNILEMFWVLLQPMEL